MMLCRVVLGRVGVAGPGIRKPPDGFESVGQAHGAGNPRTRISLASHPQTIYAVFDNAQAYPVRDEGSGGAQGGAPARMMTACARRTHTHTYLRAGPAVVMPLMWAR